MRNMGVERNSKLGFELKMRVSRFGASSGFLESDCKTNIVGWLII